MRLALALLLTLFVVTESPAADLDVLRTLAIQDGGRIKPLDTFARETARRLTGAKPFTGRESVARLDPAEWLLAMHAAPDAWKSQPLVAVNHAGLRQALGLPADKRMFSFHELASHSPFLEAAERLLTHLQHEPEATLTPIDRETLELNDTLSRLAGVFSGEALHLVPQPDTHAAWLTPTELEDATDPGSRRIAMLMRAVVVAYREGDRAGAALAAEALRSRLAEHGGASYPRLADLEREVRYNRLKPFRTAWMLYLMGGLLLLASLPLRWRVLSWSGGAAVVIGFAVHAYGMILRTLISGRAPVTNMYESVVFVAWGAVLFALVLEWFHRTRYLAACASALAVICLILADNLPIMDGSIAPLVPVLRDNFWLTTHVLTITLGYAAFLLGTGIAHANIGLYFFAPQRKPLFRSLSTFLYRSLQIGTLFLAVGTLLGGVWASYSWGRFWGWDPKETWALIALLGYLAILHGRLIGWFRDLGLAIGSILGFLLVLMAWYGVNFILGTGLHSYGFGSGGLEYVAAFVAFELSVIGAAWCRLLARRTPAAMAAGVTTARLAKL